MKRDVYLGFRISLLTGSLALFPSQKSIRGKNAGKKTNTQRIFFEMFEEEMLLHVILFGICQKTR